MTRQILASLTLGLTIFGLGCSSQPAAPSSASARSDTPPPAKSPLELGNFSVSLAVKNLAASRDFYEKLGFRTIGGNAAQNWLILQNGSATIGLFQGMFDKNTLTFNPGWDASAANLPHFQDVRDIQRTLQARGISPTPPADEASTGPAFLMVLDPDGNPILIDQHVPAPKK